MAIIQLARTLSRVNIIGTASRQESVRAVRGFGRIMSGSFMRLRHGAASLAGLSHYPDFLNVHTPSARENMAEIIASHKAVSDSSTTLEPLDSCVLIKF